MDWLGAGLWVMIIGLIITGTVVAHCKAYGVILGVIIFGVGMITFYNSLPEGEVDKLYSEYKQLKAECESNLPRNVFCEVSLTASPVEVNASDVGGK